MRHLGDKDRDALIDLVLGELPEERARETERAVAADPALAEAHERYGRAVALLRKASLEGWEAAGPRRLRRFLAPAAAAAVVLASVLLLVYGRRTTPLAEAYSPDRALGYLEAQETDGEGRVPVPARGAGFTVRTGTGSVSPLGSSREYAVRPGDPVGVGSELNATGDTGMRVDLPHGGILFLAPRSAVDFRARKDGEVAVRLAYGDAATVAGSKPLHLAVEGTDLLMTQESGAALLHRSPADAVCLRGTLLLDMPLGKRFVVPPMRRLPASCASAPQTAAVSSADLDLGWYRDLEYRSYSATNPAWREVSPGNWRWTPPPGGNDHRYLYIWAKPTRSGRLRIRFGAEAKTFPVVRGRDFRVRLGLQDLGPGPELELSFPGAKRGVVQTLLLSAVPR